MALKFGTDGVRGAANTELTPELALSLGRAAARVLGGPFVVGTDTRRSGPLIQAAFTAGLAGEGVDVALLGVVPTPAVAYVAADRGWAGAVISASHNPFGDNGIKLFAPGGRKLAVEVEARVEAELRALHGHAVVGPSGAAVGVIRPDREDVERYLDHVVATLEPDALRGLRLVLDCANGAASGVAAAVFERLGAEVVLLHAEPDGLNINDGCGATHPEVLRTVVVAEGADAGLAFDGDADRCIAVDATGAIVDGDHVIAICAIDRRSRGLLASDTVVVTVMANLGFKLAMADRGIRVVETPVGDRAVLEALDAGGFALGGEQSGHVIFRDLATTGDGLLTGVQLASVMARREQPLAVLASEAMEQLPQVLRNVRVPAPAGLLELLAPEIAAVEADLGDRGRVLVRASGTEPLLRVMVEAPTRAEAEACAQRLVAAAEQAARA